MQYFLSMNGQLIGPMTAQQVMAYNVNPNTQVSTNGYDWQPLFRFPELMQFYHSSREAQIREDGDSKKTLCGIMALLFGFLGIQYFVIGKVAGGFITILLSILTCWLWKIVTFIQGIMILCMSESEFRRKYINTTSTLPLF